MQTVENAGGRFGATSQTALPIQPIWPVFEVNGLVAPKSLILSIAIGADYSYELKNSKI